ncbi:hypothetical protein FEM03_04645 [Phragmitibacter flavus]|uniref:Uncharacterized protein n=1 Tax=Phragmitibacter flavus TaxID=2576071 RepID=A0A5R8KID3_9BACT|nr:hypothetical protein [Phragmitibacter flavus]TLD72017.1 hypothetical protein FEM03_04645 [Phragmitibacter flavus]
MNAPLNQFATPPAKEQILWLKNFRKKVGERHSQWSVDPMVAVAVEADATRLIDLLDPMGGKEHYRTTSEEYVPTPSGPPEDFLNVAHKDSGALNRILSFIGYLQSRSDYTPDIGRELGLAD